MSVTDLENRVRDLEKGLATFSQELRFALTYIQSDAGSSLTKSRLVLEKLVVQVYAHEMDREPRKPLLGEMLADNQFTRKLDRRILARMNAIRDMGNLGPHGEAVNPSDAARVLDDLCEVLDWYLRRFPPAQPSPLETSAETAAPAPQTDSNHRRLWSSARRGRWLIGAAILILALAGLLLLTRQRGNEPEPVPEENGIQPVPGQPGRWYEVDAPKVVDPDEVNKLKD